jgi:hypothetical protein
MKRTRQQKRQAANVDLRAYAGGQSCQIRLPGCKGGPTCLCHWRQIGISGGGLKSPDAIGAWGCDWCHNIVDVTGRDDPEIQLDFARAIFRTQNELVRAEILVW